MAKVVEMVKPLVFENGESGEKIVVEFNRAIIVEMDRKGIITTDFVDNIQEHPLSGIAEIWYYGLKMHQPDITEEEAEELLFDKIGLDEKLMEDIMTLFMVPYTSITNARKNSGWTMKK